MKISFIIPAYNAEKTIIRCLDSIYSIFLNNDDFEVIVIDDCSTDNTIDVVKLYLQNKKNLLLLCQSFNNKQGAARNRGVRIAKGEFICFVDSDDAIDKGILSNISLAEKKHLEMVAMHFESLDVSGNVINNFSINLSGDIVLSGIEFQNNFPYWCSAPWGYLYRKSFIQQVAYPFFEGVFYEDADFVIVHLYRAKRIAYSSDLAYLAYYNDISTTHVLTPQRNADYFLCGARIFSVYQSVLAENSEVIDKKVIDFEKSLLEGACYNISKSIKQLFKHQSTIDVDLFYSRIDSFLDINDIIKYRKVCGLYWKVYMTIAIKYRLLTKIFVSIYLSYRHLKKYLT